MKKHELIKYAYDNYPIGTRFKNLATGEETISTGVFELTDSGISTVGKKKIFLFGINPNFHWSGKWAEIIPKEAYKIAIRVDNEKEFMALMKYYDGLGWKSKLGNSPLSFELDRNDGIVSFEPNFCFPSISPENLEAPKSWEYLNTEMYKIIPFAEFTKERGIKLPILTSEDGVELCEGDKCYVAVFRCKKWFLDDHTDGDDSEIFEVTNNGKFINNENEKHFSNKQAALDWIEKANPQETVLFEDATVRVIVDAGGFRAVAESDDRTFKFSGEELKQIYNAWQEHLPF
ncbi:hypothetical protein ACJVDH_00195 [Pedobacter sp. AW1-32]|uniref:hypothetical protein n=1 Tax=Pedobacter sp. AW1-32 TaxID=3383026 RepID=UPI003FEF9997